MPLPSEGTSWPLHSVHSEKLAEHDAWYSGDPFRLETFYGPKTGVQARPTQYAGGVVGRLARWWWGTPTAVGETKAKLHVPLAADICATSADLLFSEPVRLSSEGTGVQAFLDGLKLGGLDSRLHEAAEVTAALGGAYLRTVWDSEVSPLPWTEVAYPDAAGPEWRGGRLVAVNLWAEQSKLDRGKGDVYRLVERHERGHIVYALFKGAGTNLGKQVPVQSHPDTAYLADLLTGATPAILEGLTIAQPTGATRLTAQYVPNMLPNRLHRNSPEGRSDLHGVEPFLDALDEAYSSWWRDIRHAKSRIHMAASLLESSDGPGSAGLSSIDREVYVPLEGMLAAPGATMDQLVHAQQFKIRVQEHKDTCEAWTKTIIESAGYSTQSLSGDSGGAVTATEVRAHERRSYMTRGKKIRYWTDALRGHLQAQVEVANAQLSAGLGAADIALEFEDGVQEPMVNLAATAQALRNAQAASTETLVRYVHPDWDDIRVGNEVEAISGEQGAGGTFDPLPSPDDAGL